MKLKALIVPALLALLTGCADLKAAFKSPIVQADVIDVAVAATVGTSKDTAQQRAQRIKDVAVQLALGVQATTSLETVEADIMAAIAKQNLPPADVILAQQLATAFDIAARAYLAKTGASTSIATAQVAVSTVLNQVILECKAFGAV